MYPYDNVFLGYQCHYVMGREVAVVVVVVVVCLFAEPHGYKSEIM